MSGFSMCRACGKNVYTPAARAAHMEETKHTQLLVYAFGKLRKDEACVVCDAKTCKSSWGVPLCQKTQCLNEWKYGTKWQDAVTQAVRLVRKEYDGMNRFQ
jgi:hypothetical protein